MFAQAYKGSVQLSRNCSSTAMFKLSVASIAALFIAGASAHGGVTSYNIGGECRLRVSATDNLIFVC